MFRRQLVLLLALASGVAALIYEVVWFPLLELILGSTSASIGWLLAAFMGGMCFGSFLFPKLATASRPWRTYAAIEIGIGVLGLAVLFLVPALGSVYISTAGQGITGSLLRGLIAAVCLTPPAMLMGATLPALTRCIPDEDRGSLLYAFNLIGGVIGCWLAGFYLLPRFDMATANYAAVALNVAVAAIALLASTDSPDNSSTRIPAKIDRPILISVALSGFCALSSEVLWTRTLGLLFGASAYTLSLILAVFLTGLGLGSFLATRISKPTRALAICQLLSCLAMAWAAYTMNRSLPYWPPATTPDLWFNFELDLVRALWVSLPSTILWGATFPLALRSATGDAMPAIYSANTLGSILGALLTSLWLIGAFGTQGSQRILIAAAALSSIIAMRARWKPTLAALATAALAATITPGLSPLLAAHGRYASTWVNKGEILYSAEGRNSTVAVSHFDDDLVTFHVAGKIQASNVPRDLRLQRMLGHLTTLVVPEPKSVLVIGCGAGVTAGAVSIDPRVEHLTIAEIEPLVPQAAAKYFGPSNFNVVSNPKTHIHLDDGRHFLLTSRDKFDAITVDPLDPWVSGAANLYTKEFYEAAKAHLNPGGSITMYVQLFETTPEAIKTTIATFLEVFPNGTLWGNPYNGRGHDMVLLGTVEPLHIDLDQMETRVDYRGDSAISQSLTEVGLNSPIDLFATYAGRKSDLAPWLAGAAINTDRNLRMQYLAGLGLDRDDSAAIYAEILRYLHFPEGMFTSTEGRVDSLQRAIEKVNR